MSSQRGAERQQGGAAAEVAVVEVEAHETVVGEEGEENGDEPDVGPRLPSLEDLHTAAIPTHKWPPKSARNEFTRESRNPWQQRRWPIGSARSHIRLYFCCL